MVILKRKSFFNKMSLQYLHNIYRILCFLKSSLYIKSAKKQNIIIETIKDKLIADDDK